MHAGAIMSHYQRRLRRSAVGAGLGLALLVCSGALVVLALTQETPSWWRTVDPFDPRTIQTAEAVENGVQTLLTESRATSESADSVWTVAIKAADANAWLNTRLPKWLANRSDPVRWPKELGELQVDFRYGRINVGARVRQGRRDSGPGEHRVFGATLEPRIDSEGRLWMTATTVQIGRLAIPADWVLSGEDSYAQGQVPAALRDLPETQGMFRAFAGDEAIMQLAVVRLPDGRRVRLLSLDAEDGKLILTCRTEMR